VWCVFACWHYNRVHGRSRAAAAVHLDLLLEAFVGPVVIRKCLALHDLDGHRRALPLACGATTHPSADRKELPAKITTAMLMACAVSKVDSTPPCESSFTRHVQLTSVHAAEGPTADALIQDDLIGKVDLVARLPEVTSVL
jgi:hypothetical protein